MAVTKNVLLLFIFFQIGNIHLNVSCTLFRSHSNETEVHSVKVLAVSFPPYTYFDSKQELAGGIDVLILKTIAKRLNFKLVFSKVDNFGQIPTESLKKYDLIVGGIRSDQFNSSHFFASAPYIQDDMTWCVSRAKGIPRWMNIFYIPKDAQTYIIGLILLTFTLFAAYFLTTFEEKPRDFSYMLILMVQTLIAFTSAFKPKGTLLRIHYAQFLIIPFWLTQIWSAYLVTFISRVLYENQIAMRQDIVKNHFRLAGDNLILDHLKAKNAFSQEQIRNYEVCHDIDECLGRVEAENDLAVLTSRLHVKTLIFYQNIYCFDKSQNIHDFSTIFLIRNEFAMKFQLIDVFDRILTSGLIQKWQKDLQKRQKTIEQIPNAQSISLADFSYAFIFAALLIGPITLAAILEFLIYYKAHSVDANSYWIILDKLISGKRYYFLLETKCTDEVEVKVIRNFKKVTDERLNCI